MDIEFRGNASRTDILINAAIFLLPTGEIIRINRDSTEYELLPKTGELTMEWKNCYQVMDNNKNHEIDASFLENATFVDMEVSEDALNDYSLEILSCSVGKEFQNYYVDKKLLETCRSLYSEMKEETKCIANTKESYIKFVTDCCNKVGANFKVKPISQLSNQFIVSGFVPNGEHKWTFENSFGEDDKNFKNFIEDICMGYFVTHGGSSNNTYDFISLLNDEVPKYGSLFIITKESVNYVYRPSKRR